MKLSSQMDRLGTETAYQVLAKSQALEAEGVDIDCEPSDVIN